MILIEHEKDSRIECMVIRASEVESGPVLGFRSDRIEIMIEGEGECRYYELELIVKI